MYNEEMVSLGTQASSGSLVSQTGTTEPHWLMDNAVLPNHPKPESHVSLVLVFGLMAAWAIALVYVKYRQEPYYHNGFGNSDRWQRDRMPCRSCLFFKNNPYLKCAINPLEALTPQAIGCTDYTPHKPSRQRKWSGKKR